MLRNNLKNKKKFFGYFCCHRTENNEKFVQHVNTTKLIKNLNFRCTKRFLLKFDNIHAFTFCQWKKD